MASNQQKEADSCIDVISMLEAEYETVLEELNELEKLALDIDQIDTDKELYIKIFRLNNFIYTELIRYFNQEEDYLFQELNRVLPDPSSTQLMKDEHVALLSLCNDIQHRLGDKKIIKNRKKELQALMIRLTDLLRKHINKENIVLHQEAQSLLAPEVLNYIYYEIIKSPSFIRPSRR
jgi:hemerythrin-like domain-containing protein